MKKTLLIIAIVFSGMLMQAQTTKVIRDTYGLATEKAHNAESKGDYNVDVKWSYDSMDFHITIQNPSIQNMLNDKVAEFMSQSMMSNLSYSDRDNIKEKAKVMYIKVLLYNQYGTYKASYMSKL